MPLYALLVIKASNNLIPTQQGLNTISPTLPENIVYGATTTCQNKAYA